MIDIAICNEQTTHHVADDRLEGAVRAILEDEEVRRATVSVAVLNDASIQRLNREYLQHDYPTDVLSFVLERSEAELDGEVIVSADTAAASADRFGWTLADELLLYVIHGTLHLVGYDDAEPGRRAEMRKRELHYLGKFGLEPRYDEAAAK
jgi:probable rRNA maturation factor